MPTIYVKLKLPGDLLKLLQLEATERDITIENVIAEILQEYLRDIEPSED